MNTIEAAAKTGHSSRSQNQFGLDERGKGCLNSMGMAKIENEPLEIAVRHGLVAFFDILGFSEMLSCNEPEGINTIISEVFLNIPGKLNFDRIELDNYALNPGSNFF